MLQPILRRIGDPIFYYKWLRAAWRPVASLGRKISGAVPEIALSTLADEVTSAVVVVAHPDDELFCAGMICALAERGVNVSVVCLTRGEGGHTGSWTRQELGKVREEEMRRSCAHLGASQVIFCDFVDPVGRPNQVFAPVVKAGVLGEVFAEHLKRLHPQVVVTHGTNGEYWHPAHLLVRRAVRKALHSLSQGERPRYLATYHAWQENHALPRLLNQDDMPNLFIDIRPYEAQRIRAFTSHESQLEWFKTITGQPAETLIRMIPREAYRVWRLRAD